MSQATHNILRVQRAKAYYLAQVKVTANNKQSTLGKHIRHFPEDAQACALYAQRYKEVSLKGHLASPAGKARYRLKMRERKAFQAKRELESRMNAMRLGQPYDYAPYKESEE